MYMTSCEKEGLRHSRTAAVGYGVTEVFRWRFIPILARKTFFAIGAPSGDARRAASRRPPRDLKMNELFEDDRQIDGLSVA